MDERLVEAAFGCYKSRSLEPGLVEKAFVYDFSNKNTRLYTNLILIHKPSPLSIQFEYVDFYGKVDPEILYFERRHAANKDLPKIFDLSLKDYWQTWLLIKT